jgi:hypothetical protein
MNSSTIYVNMFLLCLSHPPLASEEAMSRVSAVLGIPHLLYSNVHNANTDDDETHQFIYFMIKISS